MVLSVGHKYYMNDENIYTEPEIGMFSKINWLTPFCILATLAMYAIACWFGALNQDEGWYLYSGRLVSEGMHPFVDYASTQGPVMAYVYALAQPLVNLMGVAGGRLFTTGLGLATLFCASFLAWRLSKGKQRGVAALLVFSFVGLNLYHVYFTAIVKTYSLAGLFVVLGFIALERVFRLPNQDNSNEAMCGLTPCSGGYAFLAAGMFALAAGVRLSAGILLPAVWLTLVWFWVRDGRRRADFWVLFCFLLGGSIVLLSVFVPFFVLAPEAVKFGLLDYHSARSVGSLPVLIAYKGGFVVRLVGSYFPLVVAGIIALWCFMNKSRSRFGDDSTGGGRLVRVMLISVAAVTFVHLMTAFPYDDYQVFIMPLLAIVVGVAVAPVLSRVKFGILIVVLLILAHSVSSPMLQGWMLAKRDRIWWPLRSETQLQQLQGVADMVVGYCEMDTELSNSILLTQDTYLAVESKMRVPRGMELGPFCYFPDMEREKAEACHVLNWEMMREILVAGDAPLAAFSGYGLSISCPKISQLSIDEQAELWKIVELKYEPVVSIDLFGQADTTLRILKWSKTK